jgi:hypothetical protein
MYFSNLMPLFGKRQLIATDVAVSHTCVPVLMSHVVHRNSWNECATSSQADTFEMAKDVVDCRMATV